MFPSYATLDNTRCSRKSFATFIPVPKPLASHLLFNHAFSFFWDFG